MTSGIKRYAVFSFLVIGVVTIILPQRLFSGYWNLPNFE